MTSQNKEKIGEIVDSMSRVSKSLDDLLNSDGDESLKQQIKRTMTRLDSAMKNVEEITAKVNKGEGTIGKLINDEETVDELNTAISGVNNFLDTAGKLQTGLDFHSDYQPSLNMTKTSVGIRIQPGIDRYYFLGIVDDPAGVVETTDTRLTTGAVTTESSETKTYKSKTKFNALFAKNFYDFTIKGGLMENAGGVGIEYALWRDKLRFSLDAFEFSNLNLRAQLQWSVWKGVYVMGGESDILDKQSKRTTYFGAGLLLTNDDLKILMTKLPL
jgi:phospholipid/cholesterol/gamma-HCH transport system substrate-binding protein